MRAISHHAQAHELSTSHRAQSHELLITAATTTYVDDEILRASTRGIFIASRDGDDNNTGDDDDKCQRSARYFHIASRSGNNDNNNFRQQ
jgi:hypothetical protein